MLEVDGRWLDRHVEIVVRISAVLIGSIAIGMVLEGLNGWRPDLGFAARKRRRADSANSYAR